VMRVELATATVEQIRTVVRQNASIVAEFNRANGKTGSATALEALVKELTETGYVGKANASAVGVASLEIQVHKNERVMRCMATTMKNLGDAAVSRKGLGIEIDGILGLSADKTHRLGTAISHALEQRLEKHSPKTHFFLLMAAFNMLEEGLLEPLGRQLNQVYMSHKPTPVQLDVNEAVRAELSLLNGSVTMTNGDRKGDMRQLRNSFAHGDFVLIESPGKLWVSIEDPNSDLAITFSLPGFEALVLDTYYLAYGLLMQIMLAGVGAAVHRRLTPPT
jgi:hypothetical protein